MKTGTASVDFRPLLKWWFHQHGLNYRSISSDLNNSEKVKSSKPTYENKKLISVFNGIYDRYTWFQTERSWRFEGSLPTAPTPSLALNLKWSNFFSIGRISGLEKYVMFQHQVCPIFQKLFWLCLFPTILAKKQQFLAIFLSKYSSLYWWETDKVKNFSEKWKVWVLKIFCHPPSAIKTQKLTAVCLFKIESVLSENKKKQVSAQIWEI